jgi:hypothetical protein
MNTIAPDQTRLASAKTRQKMAFASLRRLKAHAAINALILLPAVIFTLFQTESLTVVGTEIPAAA